MFPMYQQLYVFPVSIISITYILTCKVYILYFSSKKQVIFFSLCMCVYMSLFNCVGKFQFIAII